ncbi:ArsA family ATPase [bacterium]|nr:ArsA family ATPase [bacterium]
MKSVQRSPEGVPRFHRDKLHHSAKKPSRVSGPSNRGRRLSSDSAKAEELGWDFTGKEFILFGGKGGVGKTTCAAATAIKAALRGLRTLLFSTDPAHSLSDSLEQKIGPEITQVQVGGEAKEHASPLLFALEISSENMLATFKQEYEDDICAILQTSSYLDKDDIADVFSLTIPGVDEVMGLKIIMDLMSERRFDFYVLDTAPTGHALRLLALPDIVDDWIKILAKMRYKYRYVVSRFTGRYAPDKADKFLLTMKKTINRVHALLKDASRCEFVVVTIPESMAIRETERLVASLTKLKIPIKHLIINNVATSEHKDCPFCSARWRSQQQHIQEIHDLFSAFEILEIIQRPHPVRGMELLKEFPVVEL